METKIKETIFSKKDYPYYAKLIDTFYDHKEDQCIEYYHTIYINTGSFFMPKFISVVCSAKNELAMPVVDFDKRLDLISNYSFDEVCFLLGTYFRFPFIVEKNKESVLKELPESVLKIVESSKGYLLFKEQAEELYKLATNDHFKAINWVEEWNKKKPRAEIEIENLKIEDWPLSNIFKLFVNAEMGPFFMEKPVKETYKLLKELNPDYDDDITIKGFYSCRYHGNEMTDDESFDFECKKESYSEIISNKRGDYRLCFSLKYEDLKIYENIEIGLNYEYVSSNLIKFHTKDIIHVSKDLFIVCIDIFRFSPINSGHDSFTIYAKFDSELPDRINLKNKVYKVFC